GPETVNPIAIPSTGSPKRSPATAGSPAPNRPAPRWRARSVRVAFLATNSAYGSTRSLLNLLDGLRDYNVAPHVICPARHPVAEAVRSRGLPVAVVPLEWWMAPGSRGALGGASRRMLRNLTCLPAVARLLRDWQTEVVYTNTSVLPLGAVASLVLGRLHVWHVREFGQLDHGLKPDWGNAAHDWWLNRARRIIAVSHSVRSELIGHVDPERIRVIYNGVA